MAPPATAPFIIHHRHLLPHHCRSTFKTPDLTIAPHLRPSSPVAPSFEPLSPSSQLPLSFPLSFPASVPAQRSGSGSSSSSSSSSSSIASVADSKTPAPAPAAPRRSGARPHHHHPRKHQRTPSTIEDLADAALATSPRGPPSYPPPDVYPRKTSLTRSRDGLPHHTQHALPPQYPMPTAYHTPMPHAHPSAHSQPHARREPSAKRARSEVGPSPGHFSSSTSPSTGHHFSPNALGCAHNVEQSIDRARRQSTNTATAIPSEDAELLLNFASRVQPRSATLLSPVREPPPRTAPMPVLAPSALPPSQARRSSAVQSLPVQDDASASLPSPQGTNVNEDEKNLDSDKAVLDLNQLKQPDHHRSLHRHPESAHLEDSHRHTDGPHQTRTPPDDHVAAFVQARSADHVLHLHNPQHHPASVEQEQPMQTTTEPPQLAHIDTLSIADTAADTDSPKTRPRRGWPKGKPRGPRKSSNTTKPRSTTRRSRTSARVLVDSGDVSSSDDMGPSARPRRNSESDLRALLADHPPGSADSRPASVPPHVRFEILPTRSKSTLGRRQSKKVAEDIVCSGCAQTRESSHGELDQWIGCNGCKGWFHYDCAGFKNERDVRDVDKFFCKPCEPEHGPTTYVRKSSRTHTNVDYAGLNQGILKTSDEDPEHHYIQPIKDGSLAFDPETFPRMRPELVTAEYFQTCSSFTEPILVPAEWNPKRDADLRPDPDTPDTDTAAAPAEPDHPHMADGSPSSPDDLLIEHLEYETAFDDGQDKLGMVIPQGLTVRHVAGIVGYDEPLEVIDVKTQGTEGKWNLGKFADYYEADGEKPVRNVISLEVSHTKLGRLLQRPKVVRQLDLQDSVWPAEESAKGNYPKVQFYCLMSVADSFTDFHIDFGGSSVYYHIVRGRKTFFFIPPKPSNLKAYEDWNNSPEQNFTWLPNKTKECYRVDLYEGDTMLIPSGWIHAVWTPTNSLVIGGNFLTRLHYSMQFRIVDIEKANKTPLKFRYPQFQKVMWYTVIKYLEIDPLPAEVAQTFYQGAQFYRERPVWQEFDQQGSDSERLPGTPGYNARYYSQAELDGLPEIIKFIFRTVMISLGRIEGVSEETRKKVVRSIPKSHGDPLDVAKAFALWVAWKRGNEDPPAWAHPEADLPDKEAAEPKKLSARALKQLQRQEAINAYRIAPDRQSARQQASRDATSVAPSSPAPSSLQPQPSILSNGQYTSTPKTSVLGPKRVACDACRKRRIRCKHKDQVTQATPPMPLFAPTSTSFDSIPEAKPTMLPETTAATMTQFGIPETNFSPAKSEYTQQPAELAPMTAPMATPDAKGPTLVPGNALLADPNSKRGRSKACLDCRKSKRRCVHDENGRIDPVKAEQTPVPRGSAAKKRKISGSAESPTAQRSKQSHTSRGDFGINGHNAPTMPYPMGSGYQPSTNTTPVFPQPTHHQWQQSTQSSYMYPDPMDTENVAVNNGPYHQPGGMHVPYNQQSLEQLANEVLDSRYVNNDEDGGYTIPKTNGDGMSGAPVQPVSHQRYEAGLNVPVVASHCSADSGVSLSEGSQMMGGPVQEVNPVPNGVERRQSNGHETIGTNGNTKSNDTVQNSSTERVSPVPVGLPATGAAQTGMTNTGKHGNADMHQSDVHDKVPAPLPQPSETSNNLRAMNFDAQSGETTNSGPSAASPSALIEISPRTSKSSLSNIPLYQPPPPLSSRRISQVSQTAEPFSVLAGQGQHEDARRRSSVCKTPAPMPPPEHFDNTSGSPRKRKRDSKSATPSKKVRTDANMIEKKQPSAAELEEEESMRLARELQDQELGLRRRSRV